MKHFYILIGCCSVGLVSASFVGYDLSDTDVDSMIQARNLDYFDLVPRAYKVQQRIHGIGRGGPPPRRDSPPARFQRQTPYQRPGPSRKPGTSLRTSASPSKSEESGKSSDSEPAAKASIHAKGSAAMHVISPDHFKDMYNPHHKQGSLEVEHSHKVLAAGSVQGTPETPLPNAAKLPPSKHPLVAKSQAKAVSARVQAPTGGKGHIRIEASGKVSRYHVKGGTTKTRSGTADGPEKAKVTASVTDGGHVRVMGGPTEESVTEFPV